MITLEVQNLFGQMVYSDPKRMILRQPFKKETAKLIETLLNHTSHGNVGVYFSFSNGYFSDANFTLYQKKPGIYAIENTLHDGGSYPDLLSFFDCAPERVYIKIECPYLSALRRCRPSNVYDYQNVEQVIHNWKGRDAQKDKAFDELGYVNIKKCRDYHVYHFPNSNPISLQGRNGQIAKQLVGDILTAGLYAHIIYYRVCCIPDVARLLVMSSKPSIWRRWRLWWKHRPKVSCYHGD